LEFIVAVYCFIAERRFTILITIARI